MPRTWLICLAIFLLAISLHAGTVTVSFSGTVTGLVGSPPGVNVGDHFSGLYSYDTNESGYYVSTFGYTTYNLPTFNFSLDSYNLTTYPYGEARVCDNWNGYDYLAFLTIAETSPTPLTYDYEWQLWDSTGTAFSSEQLLTGAPNLAAFDGQLFEFQYVVSANNVWSVVGKVDSDALVPEPSAMLLAGSGLLFLFGSLSRRTQVRG